MRKLILLCALMLLCSGCLLGCGAPLYPKVQMRLDPASGQWSYSSAQETDLIVGAVEASVSPDGTKKLTVGTATQPAVTYGSESVGAMAQYAVQQAEYTKMLDVVGKNTTEQIRALGEAIPNLAGLLTGLGASTSQIDTATGPLELLLERLKRQQAAVESCTGADCQ